MGSIPVRSTKKHRMQFCIRCFLVFFLVNRPRFVNMACQIFAEGLPLAGNGKFPNLILARAIIAILHSVFFGILYRESPSVRQYGLPYSCRGAPTCEKRQIPVEKKTCSHYVEVLFNAKTTFSCVSGIKRLQTSSVTVESLCPIYLLTV